LNIPKEHHLDEQQLIQAVVDERDLSGSMQTHLAACRQCRSGKESFEKELAHLGQTAERYAPMPRKRISLPVHEAVSAPRTFLNMRNAIGAVAAAAAVFLVFWGTTIVRNPSGFGTADTPSELMEAKRLISDVNMLVDNALPPLYLELSAESKPDYEKEFFQFLIPRIETRTLTSDRWKRGTSSC
jgi:hypothetical protein